MTKFSERVKRSHYDYLEKHRRWEIIDSAILENLGDTYKLIDNEREVHTNPGVNVKKKTFGTDLVYASEDCGAILFAEETLDPTRKRDQMLAYGSISTQSLKMTTNADITPDYDVFFVFPKGHGEVALSVLDEVKPEIKRLGKEVGITLWEYPKSREVLRCIGGMFSRFFSQKYPRCTELKSKGIGSFRILKTADPVFMLKYMVLAAFESDYGTYDYESGIEFDRGKLLKWFKPVGIVAEDRWRAAIKIGMDVKWLDRVSLDQLSGVINYSKVSAISIAGSRALMTDFFQIVESETEQKVKDLTTWGLTFDNDEHNESKDG